jgi:L-aminopeptidase/D-esterase-like protein
VNGHKAEPGEHARAALAGVRVGHWTEPVARTGCTVVLFPEGTVASGEIRGGAPGTREWALLAPERTVARVDAVLLTGGSAFGLAAADGVMRWCEERGAGYPTSAGPVPIVVGAVVFDLDVGDARCRPGAEEGYVACQAAQPWPGPSLRRVAGGEGGAVGAGTGAVVGRWRGEAGARPGGLGVAERVAGELVVGAVAVVNAVGEPVPLTRGRVPAGDELAHLGVPGGQEVPSREATVIGVVVTNAQLTKAGCLLVAQSAHDGLARAIDPVHTSADGDGWVAAALGALDAPVDQVRVLAAAACEAAVRVGAGAGG